MLCCTNMAAKHLLQNTSIKILKTNFLFSYLVVGNIRGPLFDNHCYKRLNMVLCMLLFYRMRGMEVDGHMIPKTNFLKRSLTQELWESWDPYKILIRLRPHCCS
jgi:hypothetical protein